jgi:tRNA(Arg) A34 adenosine deaminase TadA
MNADEKYMRAAIGQARKAGAIGEVPIGCVIVYEDKIIAIQQADDRQECSVPRRDYRDKKSM